MSPDVRERVLSTIALAQRIPRDKVTIDKTFQELGLDSLDAMNILFALETEFDLSIPDDAARSIRSVQDAVQGMELLVERQAAAVPKALERGRAAGSSSSGSSSTA